MSNRKVIVVGGNGFIGRNLCRDLVNRGEEVFSFDIQKPEQRIQGVTYIAGDFFDDEQLFAAIDRKDVIIHSLSTVNPGNSNLRYMQGYSRDFIQSIKLFEQAIKNKAKVIFLSSGGTVYGIQEKQPIVEEQLPLPINHYGTVKLCIENVIRTFNTQLHTKMLIARISNPFGPGQDYTKGVGFIDAVVKKTLTKDTIEIWGDGNVIRDYIYIDDVTNMLCSLIDYEGSEEVFNVSSGQGVSQREIIQTITEAGYEPKVTYKPARSVDVPKIILDNSKIESVCNRVTMRFKEGLEQYLDYLKNNQINQ